MEDERMQTRICSGAEMAYFASGYTSVPGVIKEKRCSTPSDFTLSFDPMQFES